MDKKVYVQRSISFDNETLEILEKSKFGKEQKSVTVRRLIRDGYMANQRDDMEVDYTNLKEVIGSEIEKVLYDQVCRQESQMNNIMLQLATTIYLERFIIMHMEELDLEDSSKLFDTLRKESINWTLKGMRGEDKLISDKIREKYRLKRQKELGGFIK